MSNDGKALAALSQWVDDGNARRDPEARTWGRLAKVSEECGEVIQAWIGVTGQNTRKGTTHTRQDVIKELLDVAVTALAAVEHMTGNHGVSPSLLRGHLVGLLERAAIKQPEEAKPCDGFRYIGQPLSSCDGCGRPYWEHTHDRQMRPGAGPFDPDPWVLVPITVEKAQAMRRRSEAGAL